MIFNIFQREFWFSKLKKYKNSNHKNNQCRSTRLHVYYICYGVYNYFRRHCRYLAVVIRQLTRESETGQRRCENMTPNRLLLRVSPRNCQPAGSRYSVYYIGTGSPPTLHLLHARVTNIPMDCHLPPPWPTRISDGHRRFTMDPRALLY